MPRKSANERIETLRQKREQLKAQLAALESRQKTEDRKRDARRKIIVGAAVLAHADLHPSFADALAAVLRVAVTRDIDRGVIVYLLDRKNAPPMVRPDETSPDHSGEVAA